MLIFGWLFRSIYNLKGAVLIGIGQIKMNFLSGLLSLPVSIIIMYLLITRFQVVGASYGYIITSISSLLIVTIVFHLAKVRYLAKPEQ